MKGYEEFTGGHETFSRTNSRGSRMASDVQALVHMVLAQGMPNAENLPVAAAREVLRQAIAQLDLPGEPVAASAEIDIPGPAQAVHARLHAPRLGEPGPVLAYFHGGGWMLGDLDTHDSFCRHLANRLKLRVLAVDYRRAPEHPFPAAYDDCLAAAEWLAGSPEELGAAVDGVVVAGDSAGGNLAAAVSASGRVPSIRAQMLLYPVTDVSRQAPSYSAFGRGYLMDRTTMEYFRDAYAPEAGLRLDGRVSPLLADDLRSVPPSVVLVCGFDVLRDEGRAYAARLVDRGIRTSFREAHAMIHGINLLRAAWPSAVPVLDQCIDDLGRFIAGP